MPEGLGSKIIGDLLAFSDGLRSGTEKSGVRYSVDVHPKGVMTDRIFRSWNFGAIDGIPIDSCRSLFRRMKRFQREFVTREGGKESKWALRPQIIHYPRGGGFFDWHRHPRHPVNYGLIASLSEQGREFTSGNTEIRGDDGTVIQIEKHLGKGTVIKGTLVLFRYDLEHRVAPCDPDRRMIFDTNGKWSAILPIY